MATNQFALVSRKKAPVTSIDRRTRKALVQSVNKITHIGDTARVAMNEMTTNYVTAERLAAQALTAAHSRYVSVPQSEMSQGFLTVLSQQYLQNMVHLTRYANDTISRKIVDDNDYDY